MKSNKTLALIAAASLLPILTQILPPLQQDALAQNATMSNQTQGETIADVIANLTQADFESVTDNLNAASEALQASDTMEAYDEVNSVESQLFELARDNGEQNTELMQLFQTLQDRIDDARDALRNNESANALQQLNSTGVELNRITEQLPVEEDEGDEGDEEDTE